MYIYEDTTLDKATHEREKAQRLRNYQEKKRAIKEKLRFINETRKKMHVQRQRRMDTTLKDREDRIRKLMQTRIALAATNI